MEEGRQQKGTWTPSNAQHENFPPLFSVLPSIMLIDETTWRMSHTFVITASVDFLYFDFIHNITTHSCPKRLHHPSTSIFNQPSEVTLSISEWQLSSAYVLINFLLIIIILITFFPQPSHHCHHHYIKSSWLSCVLKKFVS